MVTKKDFFSHESEDNLTIPMDINVDEDQQLNYTFTRYLSVIIAFGIIGYIVLIVLVWKMGSKNSIEGKTRFYFLVLAISGILLLLVLLPWIVYGSLDINRSNSLASSIWFAYFEWFLEDFLVGFLNYHLALMSLDRMMAIMHPFYYMSHFKSKQIKNYVFGILIFSLLLAVPYLTYFRIIRIFDTENNITQNMVIPVDGDIFSNYTDNVQNGTFSWFRYSSLQSRTQRIKYSIVFYEGLVRFTLVYDKLEAFLSDLLPSLILIICNIFTIHAFLRRSKLRTNKVNNSFSAMCDRKRISSITNIGISRNLCDPKNSYNQFSNNYLNIGSNNIAERISLPGRKSLKCCKTDVFSSVGNFNVKPKEYDYLYFIDPSRSSPKPIKRNGSNNINNYLKTTTTKLEILKARNKELTSMTICLSVTSLICSLPWIIFLFMKSPSWENEFLEDKSPSELKIYMLMYSQYFLTPYTIILTSAKYRKHLFRMLTDRTKC
ncbi:unnamed protein product [Gordionus sp. m RMFG-2023]